MSRIVQFVPDGARKRVAPADVAACWRLHSMLVPACYALGTAQHETDFTLNEKDVEPSGYTSYGLYQIGEDEMAQVGMPIASHDPYDLDIITIVMCDLAEARLKRICTAARFSLSAIPRDAFAYLSIAHNQGLGACLKTIAAHGLDWSAYKDRNLKEAQQAGDPEKLKWWMDVFAYGDDCITGGEHRDALTAASSSS